jgi:hypothetical protein
MNLFETYQKQSDENFVRTVGLWLAKFQYLVELLKGYIQSQKHRFPLTQSGLNSKLSMENQLLLTLLYLRNYPTVIQLGLHFGISESYSNKIYHKISAIRVTILPVKSRQALFEEPLETLIVDVTEPPIERPNKGQKADCSGKNKTHHQNSTDYRFSYPSHLKG